MKFLVFVAILFGLAACTGSKDDSAQDSGADEAAE